MNGEEGRGAPLHKFNKWIEPIIRKSQHYADRWWYGPLLGFMAAADSLVLILPSDGLLVSSTMLKPKKWMSFAVHFAIGACLGSMAVILIVRQMGLPWILYHYPGIEQSTLWTWTESMVQVYGLPIVFVIALTPISLMPALVLTGLSDVALPQLFAVVCLARILKSVGLSYLSTHAPKLLKRLWGLQDELKEVGVKVNNRSRR